MNFYPEEVLDTYFGKIIPAEGTWFPENQKYEQGIRFHHYIILFPHFRTNEETHNLVAFDLQTLQWSKVEFKDCPEIIKGSRQYTIIQYQDDKFVLFGCSRPQGGLFSKEKSAVTERQAVLGFIHVELDQDGLALKWERFGEPDGLPKLLGACINVYRDQLYILGGEYKSNELTNDLFRVNLISGEITKLPLMAKNADEIPDYFHAHSGIVSKDGYLYVLGGYTNGRIESLLCKLDISVEKGVVDCVNIDRGKQRFRPRIGHFNIFGPAMVWLGDSLFYVTDRGLCSEQILDAQNSSVSMRASINVPFEQAPALMTVYKNQLIVAADGRLYSLPIKGKIPNISGLKDPKREYFEERPNPDVTFKVKGQDIPAHRSIISERCPFLGELLTTKEKSEPVEISDISPAAFTTLLEWLYCDEISNLNYEVALELYKGVADKYSVPKLKETGEWYLKNNVRIENVFELANAVVESYSFDLETAVLTFIRGNLAQVNEVVNLNNLPNPILYKLCQGYY